MNRCTKMVAILIAGAFLTCSAVPAVNAATTKAGDHMSQSAPQKKHVKPAKKAAKPSKASKAPAAGNAMPADEPAN